MLGIWLLSTLIVVLIVYVLFHILQSQPISKDYILFAGNYYTSLYSHCLASLLGYSGESGLYKSSCFFKRRIIYFA